MNLGNTVLTKLKETGTSWTFNRSMLCGSSEEGTVWSVSQTCWLLLYCCCVSKSCPFLWPHEYSPSGSSVLHYLLEFAQIHGHHIGDTTWPSHPLPSPSLFALKSSPASGSFSSESALGIRWWKYWSFSISPFNEYSGFISIRIDWFELLAVQETLKSLLQHHVSTASILRHSAFMVQISHPYMTTGKTIALTIGTFVGKVMSLLFNVLSRFVIAFLPESKHVLISWVQSLSAVILEFKKIKSVTVSIVSIYLPWSDGTGCHDVSFLNVELQASFITLLFHPHQETL